MGKNKDQELLQDFRKENAKQYPAAQIVACQLSPSMIYLRSSPYAAKLTGTEVYCRSEKHPLTKNTQFLYQARQKELTMGLQAHLGNYQNVMQKLGDKYKPSERRQQTSLGSADLHDQLLEYKQDLCQRIQTSLKDCENITIVYANSFPCVMVHVKTKSIIKPSGASALTEASHKAWVEFLISIFTGMLNYAAFENNLHIELERRSSFGFLTPTICVTGESFRINMGVVPTRYADLITETLRKLDALIKELRSNPITIPSGLFYGTKVHLDYLDTKVVPISNLLHILFVPIETRSGLGVRNITRTAYARQGLAMQMFNGLLQGKTPLQSFAQALLWSVKRIEVRGDADAKADKKLTLSFNCKETVKYSSVFKDGCIVEDQNFWDTIKHIVTNAKRVGVLVSDANPKLAKKVASLSVAFEARIKLITSENIEPQRLENLYHNLEMLNEILFAAAMLETSYEAADDGYGSDSDCEDELQGEKLYAKKVITHNGMRSIWTALIAASKHLHEQGLKPSVFMKSAYYEVEKGFKKLISLHNIENISIVNLASEAAVLIHDINACVTDGVAISDYTLTNKNKILILDVTSATAPQVHEHLKRFAESRAILLFLVDSGLKHQQLGADKNQYGTVRMFSKSRKLTDKIYAEVLKEEQPVLSMTSHVFRRKMKGVGAVPTNRNYLKIN